MVEVANICQCAQITFSHLTDCIQSDMHEIIQINKEMNVTNVKGTHECHRPPVAVRVPNQSNVHLYRPLSYPFQIPQVQSPYL